MDVAGLQIFFLDEGFVINWGRSGKFELVR